MNEIDSQVETNDIIAEVMKIPSDQRIQFRLIQLVGNTKMKLSGVKIVRDLLNSYKLLWKSCLVTSSEECSIVCLKYLPDQFQRNIDTIYILPRKNTKKVLKELEKLTKFWEPDEIKWISDKKVKSITGIDIPILKLRWDLLGFKIIHKKSII